VGKWPEVKSHLAGLSRLLSVNLTFERELAAGGAQMSNSLHQRDEKVRRINVAELTQPIPARIYRAISHAVSAIDARASPSEPYDAPISLKNLHPWPQYGRRPRSLARHRHEG
jgi:hypothetical protein